MEYKFLYNGVLFTSRTLEKMRNMADCLYDRYNRYMAYSNSGIAIHLMPIKIENDNGESVFISEMNNIIEVIEKIKMVVSFYEHREEIWKEDETGAHKVIRLEFGESGNEFITNPYFDEQSKDITWTFDDLYDLYIDIEYSIYNKTHLPVEVYNKNTDKTFEYNFDGIIVLKNLLKRIRCILVGASSKYFNSRDINLAKGPTYSLCKKDVKTAMNCLSLKTNISGAENNKINGIYYLSDCVRKNVIEDLKNNFLTYNKKSDFDRFVPRMSEIPDSTEDDDECLEPAKYQEWMLPGVSFKEYNSTVSPDAEGKFVADIASMMNVLGMFDKGIKLISIENEAIFTCKDLLDIKDKINKSGDTAVFIIEVGISKSEFSPDEYTMTPDLEPHKKPLPIYDILDFYDWMFMSIDFTVLNKYYDDFDTHHYMLYPLNSPGEILFKYNDEMTKRNVGRDLGDEEMYLNHSPATKQKQDEPKQEEQKGEE